MADSILSQRFGDSNVLNWQKYKSTRNQFNITTSGILYASETLWGNADLTVKLYDSNGAFIASFTSRVSYGNRIDSFNIYGTNGQWNAYIFLIEVLPGTPWRCRTLKFTTGNNYEIDEHDGVSYILMPDAYISKYMFIPYS